MHLVRPMTILLFELFQSFMYEWSRAYSANMTSADFSKSMVYTVYNVGPKTLPCGTPAYMLGIYIENSGDVVIYLNVKCSFGEV